MLFAGRERLRHLAQRFQIGTLQILTAVVIEQHTLGDCSEKGAGLADGSDFTRTQQAHEGVLGKVGGIVRTAQAAAQPFGQPAAMNEVEALDRLRGRGSHSGHREHSGAMGCAAE